MSAEITSTVWGLAPWSDDLLRVSGDVDRGRAELHDYTEQLADDFGVYHRALEGAGIDYRGDDWAGGTRDYFRSIVLGSDGFREGIAEAPLARWFDTNTFYRRPVIEGAGDLDLRRAGGHGYHLSFVEASDQPAVFQPTFVSPYAFTRLSGRAEGVSEGPALTYVGDLYDELLDDARAQGVRHVLLHEPYAPYHRIDKGERAKLKQAVGGLAANHPDLQVGIYFSFGDASKLVREFADDDRLAAIGCDLSRTPPERLTPVDGHRFLAGLVEGDNTLAQDDAEIQAGLEAAVRATGAHEVSLTHTVDLRFVPRTYALEKIKQIGRVAHDTDAALKEAA